MKWVLNNYQPNMDFNLYPFQVFQDLNRTKKRKISNDLQFDSDKHRVYFPIIQLKNIKQPVLLELFFNDTTKRQYEISFRDFILITYEQLPKMLVIDGFTEEQLLLYDEFITVTSEQLQKYKNFILQLFFNGKVDIDEFEKMDANTNNWHLLTKQNDIDIDTYDNKGVLLKNLKPSNLVKTKIFDETQTFEKTTNFLGKYLHMFGEETYENAIQSFPYLKKSGKNFQALQDYTDHSSDVNGYFNDFIYSDPHPYTIQQSVMVRNIFKYINKCPGLIYPMKVARKSRRNYKAKLEKGKKIIFFPDMLISTERSDTLDCEDDFQHNYFDGSCFLFTLPKGTPAYSIIMSELLSSGFELEWLLPANSPFIIDDIETSPNGTEIIHATYAGQLNESIENTTEYKKMKYIFDASIKLQKIGDSFCLVYPLIDNFKKSDLKLNLSNSSVEQLLIKKVYDKYMGIQRNNGHMITTATDEPINNTLFMSLNNLGMNNILNNIASKIGEWTSTNSTSAPYNNRLQHNDHMEDIDLKLSKLKI